MLQDTGTQYSADTAFAASGMVQAQSMNSVTGVGGTGTIVSSGLPLPTGNVTYNAVANELKITNLGYQLHCPNGLKITWTSPAVAPPNDAAG